MCAKRQGHAYVCVFFFVNTSLPGWIKVSSYLACYLVATHAELVCVCVCVCVCAHEPTKPSGCIRSVTESFQSGLGVCASLRMNYDQPARHMEVCL